MTTQESATTHPTRNPEHVQTTSTLEEGDLAKYVKSLEEKGKKPAKLLHLLQIAVDADETEEQSFKTGRCRDVLFVSRYCLCNSSQ